MAAYAAAAALEIDALMAGHSAKPASGFMHASTVGGGPEGVATAGTLVGGAIGEAGVTTGAGVILGAFVEVGVQATSRLGISKGEVVGQTDRVGKVRAGILYTLSKFNMKVLKAAMSYGLYFPPVLIKVA